MNASVSLRQVVAQQDFDVFYEIEKQVYLNYPLHRSSYDDIMHLLIDGTSSFCTHASVIPYLIMQSGQPVGRFAMIHDHNLPGYVQVAFFEALSGLYGLAKVMIAAAKQMYSECSSMVVGLNGHLNYGAGFLLNTFEEAPVFELPYTPDYYPTYFQDFQERQIVTFRYNTKELFQWGEKARKDADLKGINVRAMEHENRMKDIQIYTDLNNACFGDHPYWSNRSYEDDLELFNSLGTLLKDEYMLIAESEGEPVGYLFWIPDFNEIADEHGVLDPKSIENSYQFRTYRFHEIAVLSKYRGPATMALIIEMANLVKTLGCQFGEGGMIFTENVKSIVMTKRYIQRIFGYILDPYRYMAVYECSL